jgi:hypothetical protein
MRRALALAMVSFAISAVPAGAAEAERVTMRENPALSVPRPILPPRPTSPPITPEFIKSSLDAHMRQRLEAAADPATGLVSVESAAKYGWGYLIDHFAEIDGDHDGDITAEEGATFFGMSPPVARPASAEIQFVE